MAAKKAAGQERARPLARVYTREETRQHEEEIAQLLGAAQSLRAIARHMRARYGVSGRWRKLSRASASPALHCTRLTQTRTSR